MVTGLTVLNVPSGNGLNERFDVMVTQRPSVSLLLDEVRYAQHGGCNTSHVKVLKVSNTKRHNLSDFLKKHCRNQNVSIPFPDVFEVVLF